MGVMAQRAEDMLRRQSRWWRMSEAMGRRDLGQQNIFPPGRRRAAGTREGQIGQGGFTRQRYERRVYLYALAHYRRLNAYRPLAAKG